MKDFFQTVRASVYGPEFYESLREKTVGYSIKYYVFLSALAGVVITLFLLPVLFSFFSQESLHTLVSLYPADLQIVIDHGQVSINQPEPYIIKSDSKSKYKNFLVIDTKSPFSGTQFADYSTYILLKKDFAVAENNGGAKIFSFKGTDNFTLNAERVRVWEQRLLPLLVPIAVLSAIMIFLGYTLVSLVSLLYFLLVALFVILLGRMRGTTLHFKDAFKVAVHASTLVVIVAMLFHVLHIPMPFLSFTLVLLLSVFLNLKRAPITALVETPGL